jgi:hypothetical protein
MTCEAHRAAFYQIAGEFNEALAMARGVLLAPVSIVPQMSDKRLFQPAIEANIRDCSFYVQVLDGSWGPPERNFENDYRLALECSADPALPMQEVVMLTAGSIEEFRGQVEPLFEKWLGIMTPAAQGL